MVLGHLCRFIFHVTETKEKRLTIEAAVNSFDPWPQYQSDNSAPAFYVYLTSPPSDSAVGSSHATHNNNTAMPANFMFTVENCSC